MNAPLTPRRLELANERERIRAECDPVDFLARVMKGQPVPVLDHDGVVIDFEQPQMEHRMNAANTLMKKLLPDLKSVDVNNDGTPGMTVVFNSPIPLPNSQPVISGTVDPAQIEDVARRKIEDAILARAEDDD